jgi:hypothetical protein
MPDNNYNSIKPVESLPGLVGTNPVNPRKKQPKQNQNQNSRREFDRQKQEEPGNENEPDDELNYRMDFKA